MADLTKIEWCDATLNLWWGCTKVSDGCKFCYAEHLADHRYNKGNWGPGGTRKEVKSWRATLNKISKRAKAEGRRLRVFCQSMSDTFEGPETMGGIDSENWGTVSGLQTELLIAIQRHPELDFLVLTKRPENVVEMIAAHNGVCLDCGKQEFTYPPNLWIGTSVEDQKTADERIPHLLKIPAAVRFLSCEPLLGPVDLDNIYLSGCGGSVVLDCLRGIEEWDTNDDSGTTYSEQHIDWVIAGGESGPNARPMHPDWARSLRDQCQAAGVPFLFKQWGEWLSWFDFNDMNIADHPETSKYKTVVWDEDRWEEHGGTWMDAQDYDCDANHMGKVGKKAAGRLLDGRTWDEFPEVAR